MTAPPSERAATRAKWAARLVRVDSHLTQAYVHRGIWQALRDEIVRINPTADGGFLASYTQIYAESLMTTIRRIADKDPDSLWATWERSGKTLPSRARQEYIDLAVAHFGPRRPPGRSRTVRSPLHATWVERADWSIAHAVACSATRRKYAESTQLLRTHDYSADSKRHERPGQSTIDATAQPANPCYTLKRNCRTVVAHTF